MHSFKYIATFALTLSIAVSCSQNISDTEKLKRNMPIIAQKGVMFGHQDDPVYGVSWREDDGRSDVKSVCSDYPAVMGFDVSKLENDSPINIDSVSFDLMRKCAVEHYERGGLVTVSWHADNIVTGSDAWDTSYPNVVAQILEGGEYHEEFLSWMDKVCNFFNTFKTASGKPVPILFRPWHEHTANHFWWGRSRCSTEEYIALWHLTVDYMKSRCPQLLFAYSVSYNTPDAESYLERFPGKEYIDLLGLDCYRSKTESAGDYVNKMRVRLSVLEELSAELGLPYAITETGMSNIPDPDFWTNSILPMVEGYHPLYVLVWRNDPHMEKERYVSYPGHPSEQSFVKMYNDPGMLFAADVKGKLYR